MWLVYLKLYLHLPTKQNRMDQVGVKMELNSASMFNVNSDLQTGIPKVGFRFSPNFCPFG